MQLFAKLNQADVSPCKVWVKVVSGRRQQGIKWNCHLIPICFSLTLNPEEALLNDLFCTQCLS